MNLDHITPELLVAFNKMQSEVRDIVANAENAAFKANGKASTYADLQAHLLAIRPILTSNGLSIIQSTEYDGHLVSVTTVIAHVSGGYFTTKASCVPGKTDAQGVGAATTYLRRYSISAVVGTAEADDDGQTAATKDTITEEQQIQLADYMEATNTDKLALCKYFKVTSIAGLTDKQFTQAMNMIKAKQPRDAA
jgi:hypothetical protein